MTFRDAEQMTLSTGQLAKLANRQTSGCWMLDAGGIQDAGCKIQVVGNRVNRQTG